MIQADAVSHLPDCGTSSLIALKGAGVTPDEIDTIFGTHLHGGHFCGLPFAGCTVGSGPQRNTMNRHPPRSMIFGNALLQRLMHWRRRAPVTPQSILVAHHLLLGDTLMLTPLLAKLRERYPHARIDMMMRESIAPLYAGNPYGVRALPFDPRDLESCRRLLRQGPYDLAYIPGYNRYSWLALAMGARWIVAFEGDRPAYTNWPVDEPHAYSNEPMPWPDMNTSLAPGPFRSRYRREDWFVPLEDASFIPEPPYVVFHVGASSALKLWSPERWMALADHAEERGYTVIWSGGPGEESLVEQIDRSERFRSLAGRLSLPQMWHLLRRASLVVCPDTGIAHLARLTLTPTISLYGPGSKELYGCSDFWADAPFYPLAVDIECRNQALLFQRSLHWVRRCARKVGECHQPVCMERIGLERVTDVFDQLAARRAESDAPH